MLDGPLSDYIPVEVNSSIPAFLKHCPSSSILHVTVDQKRILVRLGSDAVETTWWSQSVKQLRAIWEDNNDKASKTDNYHSDHCTYGQISVSMNSFMYLKL